VIPLSQAPHIGIINIAALLLVIDAQRHDRHRPGTGFARR
jgi:hypothetical protein